MKKSDIAYVINLIFIDIFSLSYCSTIWFHLELPIYYPLEHTWKMVRQEGAPSQQWYGMVAFAFLFSIIICSLLSIAVRFLRFQKVYLSSYGTKLIGIISAFVIVGCMGYLAFHEFSKWGIFW